MKTTLTHLPDIKQQELAAITEGIVRFIHPEMIILFGSYSMGNWVHEIYKENGTTYEYRSDYDILVVTEAPRDEPLDLGKKIRSKVKKAEFSQTSLHIIFHDIAYLNAAIEEGEYFF